MARFIVFPNLNCLLFLGAFISSMAQIERARADCGDKDGITCQTDFTTISSVTRTTSGFMAVGQIKKGADLNLGLLRLNRSGQAAGAYSMPIPAELVSDGKKVVGEGRKIIALPDGGAVILAQLIVGGDRQIAWALRVSADGSVVWNKVFTSDSVGLTLFHSGYFEKDGDRLIIVGRRTSGFDEGKCTSWSQSLIVTLKASDGRPEIPTLFLGPQGGGPNNRQAILDIVAGDKPNTYVTTGFSTSANTAKPGECQDDVLVQTLALTPPKPQNPASGAWVASPPRKFGTADAAEGAFAIKPLGNGAYLAAGYGKTSAGAPAAQAYRVKFAPSFSVEGPMNTPFPFDGSDKSGLDRFRAIVPLADNSRFLLVGSGSISKQDRNQALWQVVSADLKKNGPPRQFKSQTGSDITDATLSESGRIFAVGRWLDDDGQAYGWTGFINLEGTNETTVSLKRRLPDLQLPPLSDLTKTEGVYQIPAAKLFTVPGYFGRDLTDDSLSFSLTNSRTLRISALSDTGDLDLVLFDRNKRPIAFSNFKGSATEILIVPLAAGDYTISVLANSPSRLYEIRLGPYKEMTADALVLLQKIPEDQRPKLSEALISAGYASAPETSVISFGSETLRSLAAAQMGAGASQPIISATFDPFIVPALNTAR
jgi:hypothetical protein